jgi:methylphosphotriester-DNA--protein-cysteine methyltransferase
MHVPTAAAHGAGRRPISASLWRCGFHITSRVTYRPCRHCKPLIRLAPVADRRVSVAAAAAKKAPSIEELAARDQLLDLLLEAKSQDVVPIRMTQCDEAIRGRPNVHI